MRVPWLPLIVTAASTFGQSYPAPAPVFTNLFGGASGTDAATGLAVDGNGNVAVLGTTNSPDFPVTNAAQPTVPQPPLISASAAGVTYPAIGAVDVLAFAASTDGSVVYAASDSGLYRSTDGGATWTQQTPGIAGANSIAVDGGSVDTLYAAIPPNNAETTPGIYKSCDGGNTWTAVTSLFFMQYGFSGTLATPSQISGTIYAIANGFYRSTNSGASWTEIGPHNYNVFAFALAPSDPTVVYTVASDGFLYRSSDGGNTWTAPGGAFAAYPNVNALLYVSALAVNPQNENTVWALTLTGSLSKSTDGGATFTTVLQDSTDQNTLYLSISPSGSNIVESSRGGGMASFDGGASWQSVLSGAYLYAVLAANQAILGGTYVGTQGFLTKWSADGGSMLFSTFLSSSGGVIASDSAGDTFVASTTLTKFDSSGNHVFSQSLAGLTAAAIAVDSSGNVYLASRNENFSTNDCTLPPAQNGLVPAVMKFDPQGKLVYSEALPQLCPGTVNGLAVDAGGGLYLAGSTGSGRLPTTSTAIEAAAPAVLPGAPLFATATFGFLALLAPQGQMAYLSYIGGGGESGVAASGVALDLGGNVYVTGGSINFSLPFAPTADFRTCSPAEDAGLFAFAVKINLSSSIPAWFTDIGGGCGQPTAGTQVAIDKGGNVWVGGTTASGMFPTLAPLELQGDHTGFLSEFSPDGQQLLFSSYAPGDFALGPGQTLYLAGAAAPATPKLSGAGSLGVVATDALVEKLNLSATRAAVIDAIPTPLGADMNPQYLGIAPGEMISISGRGLGPETTVGAQLDASGNVATALSGTRVLFDGVPAPLISVQASSVVCMTPFEVSGQTTTSVQIERNGVAMPGVIAGVKPVTLNPNVLVIVNADGTLNSMSNPAIIGQPVILYATGFGGTTPSVPDGSLYQLPLPVPLYAVSSSRPRSPMPVPLRARWRAFGRSTSSLRRPVLLMQRPSNSSVPT